MKTKVAIIGSGNIGTDLLIKIKRLSSVLDIAVLVGIDEKSDGLARARRLDVLTTHKGIDGLIEMEVYKDIKLIFDATSAKAHIYNWSKIKDDSTKKIIDLTPAAIGPFVVPTVNLDNLKHERNINMVTCGGQATIPIIAAIHAVSPVIYGEIVASIASKSAGPGTRANIDEFTETTSLAIEKVGGAQRGKAIIVLNPAEPPMIMRDTVFTLTKGGDRQAIKQAVKKIVERVKQYVPGYSLHQEVQFEEITEENKIYIEGIGETYGLKTSVYLKVEGAGHYLPSYAGNLDIMTSAALAVGESIIEN